MLCIGAASLISSTTEFGNSIYKQVKHDEENFREA